MHKLIETRRTLETPASVGLGSRTAIQDARAIFQHIRITIRSSRIQIGPASTRTRQRSGNTSSGLRISMSWDSSSSSIPVFGVRLGWRRKASVSKRAIEKKKIAVLRFLGSQGRLIGMFADELEVDVEGRKVDDWAHVLINGTGFLNNWKCLSSVIFS